MTTTEEELEARAELRDLAIDTALESEFHTQPGQDTGDHVRPYILPFSNAGRWDPWDVHNAHFGKDWLRGMYGIVCFREDEQRTRPSRLIFSHGSPLPNKREGKIYGADLIGVRFEARHDQTNARLGDYKIVGLIMYDSFSGDVLRAVGDVPNIKLAQSTYK